MSNSRITRFIYPFHVLRPLIMLTVPYVSIAGRTLLSRPYTRSSMAAFASKLADKYEKVYVADLDGIAKNKPQLDIVQVIADELPMMYEGGVRFGQNVIDMLITGAAKAVVGTATIVSLDELQQAFKLSENITFKVDNRDGISSFDPRISGRGLLDLSRDVKAIGIDDLIVPLELVEEGAMAKEELGFSLGVFAPMSEHDRMAALGVDYIVTEDFRGSEIDE